MSKVLKNATASPVAVNDTGITVPASGQYTIPQQDYPLFAASSDVVALVGASTLVVNDGSFDLSISDGIDLLKGVFPKTIETLPAVSSNPASASKYLRYDDMNAATGGIARGTAISPNTTAALYSHSGKGQLYGFLLNLEDFQSTSKNWKIELLVDAQAVFSFDTKDFVSVAAYDLKRQTTFREASILGLEVTESAFTFNSPRHPLRYAQNVLVRVTRTLGAAAKFQAGFIALTKEPA